jgi:hypothetical protein
LIKRQKELFLLALGVTDGDLTLIRNSSTEGEIEVQAFDEQINDLASYWGQIAQATRRV